MTRISFSDFVPQRSGEDLPKFVKPSKLAEDGTVFDIFGIRRQGPRKHKGKQIGAQICFDISVVDTAGEITLETVALPENDYRLGLFQKMKEYGKGSTIGPVRLEMTEQGWYAFAPVDSASSEEDTTGDETPNTTAVPEAGKKPGKGRPTVKAKR